MRVDVWAARELPRQLHDTWMDADALHATIAQAVEAGVGGAVLDAAMRLEQLEGNSVRQAVSLALIHLGAERPDEAELVLRRHLRTHEESAAAVTHLARAQWAQNQERMARDTLRHALEVDPNHEEALLWWAALHGNEGGDEAYQRALSDVARSPAAWRARLLLGRQHGQNGRIDEAREALEAVARDYPEVAEAQRLVARERETAERAAAAVAEPVRTASIPLLAPMWTRALEAGHELLQPPPADAVRICLFTFADARRAKRANASTIADPASTASRTAGSAADAVAARAAASANNASTTATAANVAAGSRRIDVDMLSRALPMYLAEALFLRTDAHAIAIIPVQLEGRGFFVPTSTVTLETMLRWCPPALVPRLAVCGAFVDGRKLQLDVWDVDRAFRIASERLLASDPARLAEKLEERLLGIVAAAGLGTLRDRAAGFIPPRGQLHEDWLRAQGHLLSQMLSAIHVVPSQPEADVPDLCARYPSLTVPLLMRKLGTSFRHA